MKWIHKKTKWIAESAYYEMPLSSIRCTIIKDNGEKYNFNIPKELIENDKNWKEIPDDRWLDKHLTAREFMEAFAMTISESASGHDSYVVKCLIDKSLGLINVNKNNQ